MKKILVSFIITSFLSCKTTRIYNESSNNVPNIIKEYIENDNPLKNNFLLQESTIESINYKPILSEPYWVVPSKNILDIIDIQKSNNNVSIAIYNNKIYLAFRTGPTHFASKKTGIYVVSSNDAINWKEEISIFIKKDVREPFLIPINNTLHFYFFSAGENMASFTPENIYHYKLSNEGEWNGPEKILNPGEIHWSIKNRNGKTYMTSYIGSHYKLNGPSEVELHFKTTTNGVDFKPIKNNSLIYKGGVSECAFEFDNQGNLWGVSRLEDGDKTGFGSHVIYAEKDKLSDWKFPDKADPRCFMSPRMFNHNNELYLIARKHLGEKPFQKTNTKFPLIIQRINNWLGYSFTRKTSALYKINKELKKVEWVLDLPGEGDTGFPSIIQLDKNTFIYANYSSPINKLNHTSWIRGQLSRTGIYFQMIKFVPK